MKRGVNVTCMISDKSCSRPWLLVSMMQSIYCKKVAKMCRKIYMSGEWSKEVQVERMLKGCNTDQDACHRARAGEEKGLLGNDQLLKGARMSFQNKKIALGIRASHPIKIKGHMKRKGIFEFTRKSLVLRFWRLASLFFSFLAHWFIHRLKTCRRGVTVVPTSHRC